MSSTIVGRSAARADCSDCSPAGRHVVLRPASPTKSLQLHVCRHPQPRRARSLQTTALFGAFKRKARAAATQPTLPTVIPEPSYNVPAAFFAAAGVLVVKGVVVPAAVVGVLGGALTVLATRVRLVFGPTDLSVDTGRAEDENVFVGGENRWAYDTFTNWEFFWPKFPVIAYFKETQTKPEGQVHFFIVLSDGKKVYETMLERCGPTQNSGRK